MENKDKDYKTLLIAMKIIWFIVAVLVLFVTLYSYDGKTNSDIWIFLTWSMLILSFPASLLVSLTHMLLGEFFSITVTTSYLSLTIEWGAYFILGYVQWFILIPHLITIIKNRIRFKET